MREVTGVVWAVREAGGGNLKSILDKRDLPPLREPLRRFVDWVANWTLAARGMVLRMGIRAPDAAGPEPVRLGVRLTDRRPERMTPARARVIAAAQDGFTRPKSALAELSACSTGVVDALIDDGVLEALALPPEPVAWPPDPTFAVTQLEPNQSDAASALRESVAAHVFSVTLLEGVTGSGKTEVYFEAVAAAILWTGPGRRMAVAAPDAGADAPRRSWRRHRRFDAVG
jgi:primosomal protein N' (replication factor Y)